MSTVSNVHIPISFSSIYDDRKRNDEFYGEGISGLLLRGDVKARCVAEFIYVFGVFINYILRSYFYQGARAIGPSFTIEKSIANIILSVRKSNMNMKDKTVSPEVSPMAEIAKLQQVILIVEFEDSFLHYARHCQRKTPLLCEDRC